MDLTEFESVRRWQGRLKPNSFRVALLVFDKWYSWVKEVKPKYADFTPDDFVEYQKNADNGSRYDILDTVQDYVGTMNSRASYKRRVLSGVRSFFMHNRAELPKDPGFIVRGDKEKVVGQLNVEDIRKIILSSNLMYQAIFTSMFQGGMGIGEFEYWNVNGIEDLKKQLKQDPGVLKVDLPGRKKLRNLRPFYTYIGGDALDRLRRHLDKNPRESGPIFVNQFGNPVTRKAIQQYWIRHLRKLGYVPEINHGVGRRGDTSVRYGLNVHELRDCFRSQWEKSPAKVSVAEFCMGHQVDPLEYNKAFRDENWTLKEYRKALPMLQIFSSGRPYGQVDESEVERLRRENEELRRDLTKVLNERESEQANIQSWMAKQEAENQSVKEEMQELRKQLKQFLAEKEK